MSVSRKARRKNKQSNVNYKRKKKEENILLVPRQDGKSAQKMKEMKKAFGIEDEDISSNEPEKSYTIDSLTELISDITTPISDRKLFLQPSPDEERPNRASRIMEEAQKYLGLGYRIHGDGLSTMDSGQFVQKTLNDTKIYDIASSDPNDIMIQFISNGRFDDNLNNVKLGDVLFFANTYGDFPEGTATHCGFCVNMNSILHANSMTKSVAKTEDYNYYWKHYFIGFGRI